MREQLYDLAFRYKKAGLWKKLWDTDIFAIKLTSGEIGYISIMGKNGEYCALGLYIGEEGFQSYRTVSDASGFIYSEFAFHEALIQQNCLQMALLNKDDLMKEEVEEVRAYAKAHNRKLGGKNAYPQFLKYEPNHVPWKVKTKKDEAALMEALEASVLLAEILQTIKPETLGIEPIHPFTKSVPLFEVKEEKLNRIGRAALPEDKPLSYPSIKINNDIAIKTVKKLPRQGVWEAEFIRVPQPIQDEPDCAPYFPLCLLMTESLSHYVIVVVLAIEQEHDPQAIAQQYANNLKNHGICPEQIRCYDERTYALLEDFCEKANIKVGIDDREMLALNQAKEEFFNEFMKPNEEDDGLESIMMILDSILEMSPTELREIPKPVLEEIKELTEILPAEYAAEIRRKLKGLI